MTNEEVLCEVTENHLNTGLRGIPVGTVRLHLSHQLKGYTIVDIQLEN